MQIAPKVKSVCRVPGLISRRIPAILSNVVFDRHSMDFLDHLKEFGLNQLHAWTTAKGISCGLEQSARFSPGVLETRRCLLSVSLAEIGADVSTAILCICQSMNAPETFLQSIARFLNAAAFVHFGFEYSGNTLIGKCYLELPFPQANQPLQSGRLQFLGFKWSLQNSSVAVVSRYRSSIVRRWPEIRSLLMEATDPKLHSVLRSLLLQLQPIEEDSEVTFPLLEIVEEGSDRRSWDLNVYSENRSLGQIQSTLLAAVETLQISHSEFFPWILQNTTLDLGHIATGVGRNGDPFLTIYYGARGIREL